MEQKNLRARLGGIDLLRCFFALEVIFIHSASPSRYPNEVNALINNFDVYVGGCVLGFFMISGFFARHLKTFDVNEFVAISRKLFIRLGVPFFFFSTVYAIGLAVLGKQSLMQGLLYTVILKGSSMQLYFLPYLFLIALSFVVISSILVQLRLNLLYSLIGLMVSLFVTSLMLPTPTAHGPSLTLLPLYTGAYLLGYCFSYFWGTKHTKFWMFALGSFTIAGFLSTIDSRFISISITIALFLLALLASNNTVLRGKSYYGSGGVYLLHTPILNFTISSILLRFGLNSFLNLYLTVFITYFICLVFTVCFVAKFKPLRYLLLE